MAFVFIRDYTLRTNRKVAAFTMECTWFGGVILTFWDSGQELLSWQHLLSETHRKYVSLHSLHTG